MSFTQSASLTNNPKILNNYLNFTETRINLMSSGSIKYRCQRWKGWPKVEMYTCVFPWLCWLISGCVWIHKGSQKVTDILASAARSKTFTQYISWRNGNENGDHLAPLGNYTVHRQHWATAWDNLETTWHLLGTAFGHLLGSTWTTLEHHLKQFGDNFETALGRLWYNFRTTMG